MASKGTPKKLYKKPSGSTVISRCRLCNTVADPQYSKNLFRDSNRAILRNAETLYGGELLQSGELPHLVCRPCERRLNTALQFKRTIGETRNICIIFDYIMEEGCSDEIYCHQNQ